MPLTRSAAESLLVPRAEKVMEASGLPTTRDGSNPTLDGPLSDALMGMLIFPASPESPGDSDLARVPDGRVRELLLRAEVRLKQDVHAALLVIVSQQVGGDITALSDMAAGLLKNIAVLQAELGGSVAGGPSALGPASCRIDEPRSSPDLPHDWHRWPGRWR